MPHTATSLLKLRILNTVFLYVCLKTLDSRIYGKLCLDGCGVVAERGIETASLCEVVYWEINLCRVEVVKTSAFGRHFVVIEIGIPLHAIEDTACPCLLLVKVNSLHSRSGYESWHVVEGSLAFAGKRSVHSPIHKEDRESHRFLIAVEIVYPGFKSEA